MPNDVPALGEEAIDHAVRMAARLESAAALASSTTLAHSVAPAAPVGEPLDAPAAPPFVDWPLDKQVEAIDSDWRKGQQSRAVARAKAALQRAPDEPFLLNLLGAAHAAQNEIDTAAAYFERAAAAAPDQLRSLRNLARLFHRAGRHSDAAALYRRIADDSEHADPVDLLCYGETLCELGEIDKGVDCLAQAARLKPGWPTPLFSFTNSLRKGVVQNETLRRNTDIVIASLTHPRITSKHLQAAAAILMGAMLTAAFKTEDGFNLDTIPEEASKLATAVLSESRITNLSIEKVFIAWRNAALHAIASPEHSNEISQRAMAVLEAMATHSAAVEFIWPETPEETPLVAYLHAKVSACLLANEPVRAQELFMLACYRPLDKIPEVRRWVAFLADQNLESVDPTLSLLVLDPMRDEILAQDLPQLSPIEGETSEAVRAMYEENPYPRWRKLAQSEPRSYAEHVAMMIEQDAAALDFNAVEPKVLVAGCGTGQHPITVAVACPKAQIIGLDLSSKSLAYAMRTAAVHGVSNISFAQGDLLKLEGLDEMFDAVEVSGVLHHLKVPEEGLASVVKCLKPGGLIRIGLYSTVARRDVYRARMLAKEMGLQATLEGLRSFRTYYLENLQQDWPTLETFGDFYSTSELRDLVFHVQEHTYTPTQIAKFLATQRLEFLGFSSLDMKTKADYDAFAPHDATRRDLASWEAFEELHPNTFAGMFQFWARKPAK